MHGVPDGHSGMEKLEASYARETWAEVIEEGLKGTSTNRQIKHIIRDNTVNLTKDQGISDSLYICYN